MKKLFTLLTVSLLITLSLNAQESKDDYKMISKNGKLYINKNIPLYLLISSSPDDDAKYVNMEGTRENEFANPFYLDTEGHNIALVFAIGRVIAPIRLRPDSIAFTPIRRNLTERSGERISLSKFNLS